MDKKVYICRKIYLYNFLCEKGFTPISYSYDKYNPKFLVWVYQDSAELRNAVEEYYSVKRY